MGGGEGTGSKGLTSQAGWGLRPYACGLQPWPARIPSIS